MGRWPMDSDQILQRIFPKVTLHTWLLTLTIVSLYGDGCNHGCSFMLAGKLESKDILDVLSNMIYEKKLAIDEYFL